MAHGSSYLGRLLTYFSFARDFRREVSWVLSFPARAPSGFCHRTPDLEGQYTTFILQVRIALIQAPILHLNTIYGRKLGFLYLTCVANTLLPNNVRGYRDSNPDFCAQNARLLESRVLPLHYTPSQKKSGCFAAQPISRSITN